MRPRRLVLSLIAIALIGLLPRSVGTLHAQQADPEAMVEELIGQVYFDLCFTPSAMFDGQVRDAAVEEANGKYYAFVLMELYNKGPQTENSASAVLLVDQDFNGGRMTADVPDEDEYFALVEELGAITPFDAIPVRTYADVLFVFVIPPGAYALGLSPNPTCHYPR